ncbi:MAG: ATP-binding cassette domain-containing protein [Firmicutes bacterium]|nr:ATP-binding cassette domain-containing protein [Candidatus Caballimonas caccae]
MADFERENCALKLENIVKVYGSGENKVQALKGIDLNFRKNEFVSILGPSGCGKTTLLNIIGGLDRYTSGDLIIEGKSTKNYNDKDWDAYRNNSIGFVFQSYNLIPHQTVLGNVELALELSGVKKAERKERAIKMLEKVGLKDQLHKKPNQLSGGQMQRVAIARALINDPEIILADEPTGALDTETSVQIMELLKEVAKDKLVIMVTHNPDLAKQYSTRIINFLDGEKVGDSNPFNKEYKGAIKTQRKPKMGFKTAFGLSLKNLISKRARTILTSIAGSIGIIGVALVLALSNGFSMYINRMQTDTLATYPISITETQMDMTAFAEMTEDTELIKYPKLEKVVVKKSFENVAKMFKPNNITNGYINYLNNIDKNDCYAVQYDYGFKMNDFMFTDVKLNGESKFCSIGSFVRDIEDEYNDLLSKLGNVEFGNFIPTVQELPNSAELLNSQYDLIYKLDDSVSFESVLSHDDEMILVVKERNDISDFSLALLGYLDSSVDRSTVPMTGMPTITFSKNGEEVENIPFTEALGKTVYYATSEQIYEQEGNSENFKTKIKSKDDTTKQLKIVGIARVKEDVNGILDEGFAYSPKLTQKALEDNKDNAIYKKANEIFIYNMTKSESDPKKSITIDGYKFDKTTRYFAGGGEDTIPEEIKIYAKDFEAKERIKTYLDAWNDSQEDENNQVKYTDLMSILFEVLTTMVDAVTIVLIAFTSVSLVVSSVMIGIITYTSVVERTKEIGVLRSLGASKGEISNVFNAETFIIGLCSGLIGIIVTYILCIPINIIAGNALAGLETIASLKPLTALLLVCISFCLTIIAGLIPSRIASKKDPVVALRSE